MCDNCWRQAGSPTERSESTGRVIELIEELYADHPTGGPLHSVLDNWNLSGTIEPYRGLDYGAGTYALCDKIAALLNAMTEPQRYAALAYADGLIK